MKSLSWIAAVLAPELVALKAVQEFWEVKLMVARCNSAQPITDSVKRKPGRSSPEPKEAPAEITMGRSRTPWNLVQGFCIRMHGLVLRTKDDWVYIVRPANVVGLIEASVIKQSDLRVSEINDRAKADSFAKAFTLLQSTWVTCNIIARAAYSLPITAIEISTVAYVACALITYAAWWHKPKDMTTPIVVHLPYDHDSDEMPPRVRSASNAEGNLWIHLPPVQEDMDDEEPLLWLLVVAMCTTPIKVLKAFKGELKEAWKNSHQNSQALETSSSPQSADTDKEASGASQPTNTIEETSGASRPMDRFNESLTIAEQCTLDALSFIAAIVFCGIHLAA
jgi:hypothetical protein